MQNQTFCRLKNDFIKNAIFLQNCHYALSTKEKMRLLCMSRGWKTLRNRLGDLHGWQSSDKSTHRLHRFDTFASRATPRQPLRNLYRIVARARALGCHCSCSLFLFRISLETRTDLSLPAGSQRLSLSLGVFRRLSLVLFAALSVGSAPSSPTYLILSVFVHFWKCIYCILSRMMKINANFIVYRLSGNKN